ncbi:AraC family transcriptional regulator [Ruminococcus sp. AF46-10NS]|nr:AraC family transcriptional regulator [Ruminococcus sp. AF46-10NS]
MTALPLILSCGHLLFRVLSFSRLLLTAHLRNFFFHVLYQKTEGNFLIFHAGEDAQIRSTLEDLYIEYMLHARYRSAFLNAQLMMLWAQLLRYHENDIESILTKSSGNSSIPEILNYLSQNYRTATLHDTAAHFGYSTSHFSTLIREGTGRTFLTIIKELKLSQASRALRETSLSISSICELTGYENPEHFMRLFKKTYGMTPGEYRKEHREN